MNSRRFLLAASAWAIPVFLCGAYSMPSARGDESAALAERLLPLIKSHQGLAAVAVKHLKSGEQFAYREDEVMPTASLIKFPVLIELYRQAESGRADLNKMLELREEDKAPGSGVLTYHFSPGARLSLRDAARLMIAFSDNTATNLVLDEIGLSATSETMRQLGYPNTQLHDKVFLGDKTSIAPERSKKYGLGSTAAAEMLRLCEALHKEELISKAASATMLEHLKACQDRDKFPRLLPPGTIIAFKTGSVNEARTAAGLIESPGGTFALCVLTSQNEDRRWTSENAGDVLCARLARECYDYFNLAAAGSGEAQAPGK